MKQFTPDFHCRRKQNYRLCTGLCLSLLLAILPARSGTEFSCGEGISLYVSSETPRQGSVFLLTLRSEKPLNDIRGLWRKRKLYFWPGADSENLYQALAGVDLSHPAQPTRLQVTARRASGREVRCTVNLTVADGDFAVERLKVNRRFVELSRKNQQRARRESKVIQKIWATVTPERLWEGPFRQPLDKMKSMGNFGKRRILNGKPRSPHTGIDLSDDIGAPIYATQRGRVALARNLFYSGNMVILDHGLGFYTYYAHMHSMKVKEGALVKAGEVLGVVGKTGRVTGAHLHWAARVGRARFNPMHLLTLPQPSAAANASSPDLPKE